MGTAVTMKTFCMLLATAALASADSSGSSSGSSEEMNMLARGLYFNPMEVDIACTVGSPMGAKLAAAFKKCIGGESVLNVEEVGATERKRWGKKPKRCPTTEQIMGRMNQGMEGDWCVLYQLGWIDETGKENEAIMTADMASLSTDVTASLSEEAINSCAAERMEKIQKKLAKKFRKCADNYSEEELNQLEEMGQKIQAYKCFKAMFHNSCQQKVKEEIVAFFKAQASTPAPTTAAPTGSPTGGVTA